MIKGFYTAKQAQKKLGVTDDKFQYMVRTGQVKKVILPGRKYGAYPEEDINRLAEAMEAAVELYVHDASVFELATEADLFAIYSFVRANMPRVTPIEKQRAWIERNPESFYTLRDNGVLVAYACIFPVQHDWLLRVLRDEIRIGDVLVEAILPFKPGMPLDLYIRDLVVGKAEKKAMTHYAQRMILELLHVLNNLGARGIEIRAIYALATTPQAHNLCQRLRFVPMSELEMRTEGYMPYRLDIATAKSALVDGYRQQYATSKSRRKAKS